MILALRDCRHQYIQFLFVPLGGDGEQHLLQMNIQATECYSIT